MDRIAVLVKQVPALEEMELDATGHLIRDGAATEMSAYCRRAVSMAVTLAGSFPGCTVTVFTLGPPTADDALREAVCWAIDHGVAAQGVLLTDPLLAGSDTRATAAALAAAVELEGPFDLILSGKNSLDSDTGQVPPQLAQLLDLPFLSAVKTLTIDGDMVTAGCEHDDAWLTARMRLPGVLSCAERLCEPAKVAPQYRTGLPAGPIRVLRADDLGPGPWGIAASRTVVSEVRQLAVRRSKQLDATAPLAVQVQHTLRVLVDSGVLAGGGRPKAPPLGATGGSGPLVAVLAEPGQDGLTQELCGAATLLADALSGSTVVLAPQHLDPLTAGSWGADQLVQIDGACVEEDVAEAVAGWAEMQQPWAVLVGSTSSGREIAARVAAAIGAGLTGDAVDLRVENRRLVAAKPAFAGRAMCEVLATSAVQMATVRPGVLVRPQGRAQSAVVSTIRARPRHRVTIMDRRQNDSLERLAQAEVVVGVGAGVGAEALPRLDELIELLGAELGCTRKLTDSGSLPHSGQIGITGRSISPRLYLAIGTSGKFNHMVGVRSAGMVLAINHDPQAPLWEHADVGIVGDWRASVDMLVEGLRTILPAASPRAR